MAFSYNEVGPVDPGFTMVTLTFPFLERLHVSVMVDKVPLTDTAWSWISDSQIELNDPLIGGEVVKAFRTTPAAGVKATFQPGAFNYEELNTSLLHLLYIVQEAYDNSSVAVEAGNNAFSYLMQIEDLVDDAEIIFADMQALYAGYKALSDTAMANLTSARSAVLNDLTASANSALTALSLARGNALTNVATALSSALTAISTDRAGALSAISTDRVGALSQIATALSSAVTAITAARNSAITAVDALVTQAQGFRDTAEGHKNAAATSATNAAISEANAAASVVGAVKANQAQAFLIGEKLQARTNIGADRGVAYLGTYNATGYGLLDISFDGRADEFDTIEVRFNKVRAVSTDNTQSLLFRYLIPGDQVLQYRHQHKRWTTANGEGAGGSIDDSVIQLFQGEQNGGSLSYQHSAGRIILHRPSDATFRHVEWHGTGFMESTRFVSWAGGGYVVHNTPATGIRLFFGGGAPFANGIFSLYGYRK